MLIIRGIKDYLKTNYPTIATFLTLVKTKLQGREKIFSKIYYNNCESGLESISGFGSDLVQAEVIIKAIPDLIAEIEAKTLLDAPCGDFHWMKEVKHDLDLYIGVDIVKEIIVVNNDRYSNSRRRFMKLDILKDELPRVDIILCRDCLVHLSFKDISATLANFKRTGSKYFLTTTFPQISPNIDIVTGGWRPINFQSPPFNFPEPIKLINEKCTERNGAYADKSLGLWRFADIWKKL